MIQFKSKVIEFFYFNNGIILAAFNLGNESKLKTSVSSSMIFY